MYDQLSFKIFGNYLYSMYEKYFRRHGLLRNLNFNILKTKDLLKIIFTNRILNSTWWKLQWKKEY